MVRLDLRRPRRTSVVEQHHAHTLRDLLEAACVRPDQGRAFQDADTSVAVALVDPDGATLGRTAEQIGVDGGEALPFENDVTDSFQFERSVDLVIKEWGRLDILVNNAGIFSEAPIEDMSDERWAQTMEVNLRGTMFCTRTVVPHMLERGWGRILSAASAFARTGRAGYTAYAASKAGIIGMTKSLAKEMAPRGITVNSDHRGRLSVSGISVNVPGITTWFP